MSQAEALEYFRANSGYARMKDLKKKGIHPRVLRSFLVRGLIEKIKPGVYKLRDFHSSEHQSFVDLSVAIPKGVVCLFSALHYYGLCDIEPPEPQIAVPQGYRIPGVKSLSFEKFFFSKPYYEGEIEVENLEEGSFRIYSREKCLVDTFRLKRRYGLEAARKALIRYGRGKHRHLGRLLVLARQARVYNVMLPYLDEVM